MNIKGQGKFFHLGQRSLGHSLFLKFKRSVLSKFVAVFKSKYRVIFLCVYVGEGRHKKKKKKKKKKKNNCMQMGSVT